MAVNPYELSTTWVVFNPTPKTVEARFDGWDIVILPFTKFSTAHKVVHDHLTKNVNFKNRGLVSWTFTDEMKRLYGTEAEFQKQMSLEGLRNIETFLEMTLNYENIATQANKIQKVPSFLKSKVEHFQKELDEIRILVTKYLEKSEAKSSESGTDKNKSEKKT
ncbi:MAG: hypothetical protein SFW66_08850 [Gammaproteobacteria bacterium]|nr:hypothetical protein [Gammaproteobacteria bacterium]